MILHKIKRPNSLKTFPSGVTNCLNLPFGRSATRGSMGASSKGRKTHGVATNVYLRKMLEKPKVGLQILRTKVQELFTCGEGISTPHVYHKGRQPLIKYAKSWLQILFYFPFLRFSSFWGRQEWGSFSYVSSIAMRNSNLHSSLQARSYAECWF